MGLTTSSMDRKQVQRLLRDLSDIQCKLDDARRTLLRLSGETGDGKLSFADIYGVWAGSPVPSAHDHAAFKRLLTSRSDVSVADREEQ